MRLRSALTAVVIGAAVSLCLYSLGFGAAKYIRPEFLKHDDSYVGWFEVASYPARYVCALFGEKSGREDGMYVLDNSIDSGEVIFLSKDHSSFKIGVVGESNFELIRKTPSGASVFIQFGRRLDYDNDTFKDFFRDYVKYVGAVGGQKGE